MQGITSWLRSVFLLLILAGAGDAGAQQIQVTNANDSGSGSLRAAILEANAQAGASQTIVFASGLGVATITLASPLPAIDVGSGTLTIDGSAATITVDGAGQYRVFFVESGDVTLQEFDIDGGSGQGGAGGDGGSGAGGGGGGLGAGGALFVDAGAKVTLDGVFFDGNAAVGGSGGGGSGAGVSGAGGGGGGLQGDGGSGSGGGGGGGGLVDDPGAPGAEADGGNGTPGAQSGSGGDGGGFADGIATGGVGGGVGAQPSPAAPFGGGGGAGPTVAAGVGGGDGGGFGGGGGGTGAGEGGDGGFGGGGGGTASGTAGTGGFGGGDGGSGTTGGGGGDGLGGAIFVRAGGELVFVSGGIGTATANTATGGSGADGGAGGSAAGAGLYLMDGVDLEVDTTGNLFVQDAIGGEGGITKIGTGTLTLTSADNDYGGGTVVQEGVVVGLGAEAIQGAFVLAASDVELQVSEGDAAGRELTAFVSGAGSVQIAGNGKVILNPTGGSNSWTGGTQIGPGSTLESSAGHLPGAGTVNVSGELILNEADGDDETWSGDLTSNDTAVFRKTGTGTSRLTGDNAFNGAFRVEEGTLRGNVRSLPDATTNPIEIGPARLVFDQTSDASFDGELASIAVGDGELEKLGGGTLTLAGDSPQFTGDAVVGAGTLRITGTVGNMGTPSQTTVSGGSLVLEGTGTLHADATVAPGARLGGNTAGSANGLAGQLVMNGTLAPGDGVATLHVDGVGFGVGSSYEVEFDLATAQADLLVVDGDADLAGSVDVTLLNAGAGDRLRIVDVVGGSDGGTCFDGVTNAPGFFDIALDCDDGASPEDVFLVVDFDDAARFADFATTPNQLAVATALDPPPDPAGAPFADPWDAARFELVKIPGELPAALDDLGGEALTAFTTARLANAQEVGRVVSGRMRQVGGREVGSAGTVDFLISESRRAPRSRLTELGGALLASNQAEHALALAAGGPAFGLIGPGEGRRFGFWADGYGVMGHLDGDGNASATDWWSAGALVGFDVTLGEHGLLGLTGGWAHLVADPDGLSLDGDANVYQGGLYGAYVGERLYVGGLARYAYSDFDTTRALRFAGTSLDGRASAEFSGQEAGGFVELGYVAFAPAGWQIEPMLAGHFNWLSREGFRENGSDPESEALALDVEEESWTSIVSVLGVRLHKRFLLERHLAIQPEIWGAWAHEFGDRGRSLDARFQGAAGGTASFRVLGATAARDGAQFGAGWSVSRNDVSFFLYYDGNANADLIDNGLTAGVLIRW